MLGGRYRLEASIGTGGMAQVFRGIDTTLDRTVAIKIWPRSSRADPARGPVPARGPGGRPARPTNIVNVYDTGVDGDTNYIVME